MLTWVQAFGAPTPLMTVDSSGASGSPSPPAEGALVSTEFPQLVRVTGPAAGTYRVAVM